jgi:predicted MFS family arabinose efflux permease
LNDQKTWRALLCVALVSQLSFGLVIPMLPAWGEHLGAATRTLGYLFACYSLAQLFSVPALGTLSDRWGHRRVLLLCLAGTVLSFVMTALAQTLAVLFAARILDGLTGGSGAVTRAMAARLWDGPERARAMGTLALTLGIGFVLGPALGASLSPLGLMAPAWAGAALAMTAFLLAVFFLSDTPPADLAQDKEITTERASASLTSLYLANGLIWVSLMGVLTTVPVLADKALNLTLPQIGLLLSSAVALTAVGQVWGARYGVSRWGHRRTVAAGTLLMACGVGLMGTDDGVLVGLALTCVAVGPVTPALLSWLSESGGTDAQGKVHGFGFTAEVAGRAAGAVLAYELLQRFGQGPTYFSLAAVLGVSLVLVLARGDKHAV